MNLQSFLSECDTRFDEQVGLIGMKFISPGYHTRTPEGKWVHASVHNFEYAILLLRRGGAGDVKRAERVLEIVLGLQEKDPTAATYGVWAWLFEEPLAKMAPPDWNWADFCGGRIAEILTDHAEQLSDRLVANLRAALFNAGACIFRRNVRPDYTNIGVMGGGVSAAAGELLNERWLLDYGARRLQNCVDHTKFHGGFNEYNSPSYTTILIQECERLLAVVRNASVRESAEWLRCKAWETISEHFHPATGQWAGPHCRAYETRVDRSLADFIGDRTGVHIEAAPGNPAALWTGPINVTVKPVACPPEFIPPFSQPVSTPVERVRRFVRREPDSNSTYGTTWLTPDACLGSVTRGLCWIQQKTVIAYWKTPLEQAVVLRLRFLHDGRDFTSAIVRSAQKDGRVLSAVNLATDMGDFSWQLDCAGAEGFAVSDLRLRYQITGRGAEIRQIADGRYLFSASPWSATLHALPGHFGSWPVCWEIGGGGGDRWVDAICYQGPKIQLHPGGFGPINLAAGLELARDGSPATTKSVPSWSSQASGDSMFAAEWDGLRVESPVLSERYL